MTRSTYLYHSFPRRSDRSKAFDEPKGESILRLMTKHGLLLAPEVITWIERSRNNLNRRRRLKKLQQRFCLTELRPNQLLKHSKIFGRYALEFELPIARFLGAMPVFYVSTLDPPQGFEAMGASTIFRLEEIRGVLDTMARIQLVSAGASDALISEGLSKIQCSTWTADALISALFSRINTPLELRSLVGGVMNLFYPVDSADYPGPLRYYRQREWRIAGRLSYLKKPTVVDATRDLQQDLKRLDPAFFGRTLYCDGRWKVASRCLLYPSFREQHVMTYVRRVICPRQRVTAVRKILRQAGLATKVVALEQL